MGKILRGNKGQAMAVVLVFLGLSLPLIISSVTLAGTVANDASVKTRLLRSQYSALGAQQLAIHSILGDGPEGPATTTIELNGKTITTTIWRVPTPPGLPSDLSSALSRYKLSVSKAAVPTTILPNATTTYTISVLNRYTESLTLSNLYDTLPNEFSYVSGSSVFRDGDGAIVSTQNPTVSGQTLYWDVPNIELLPGETATMTLVAKASASAPAGYYCNEAYTRSGFMGWWKTTSGKTAKIRIGSPGDTRCAGAVISVSKTVQPELVTSDTATDYTYRITIANEGTRSVKIWRILDKISDGFTYVPFSVSTTPSLGFGEPSRDTVNDTITWQFGSYFLGGKTLSTGTTWYIDFKANAQKARGQYPNEVELTYNFFEFLPSQTTWPTAPVTIVDYYEMTMTDGQTTYTCHIWVSADVDGNDIYLLEECAIS